jgi:murein DD-endopeptidase MepM/ murein hydrolase activator NlpD
MSAQMIVLMLLNTLLPLLALWWLIAPQRCSRLEWIGKILLIAAYLFCVAFASIWLVPSVYAPYWYPVLLAVAIALSWLTVRKRPWLPTARAGRVGFGVYLVLAAILAAVGVAALPGRGAPGAQAFALEFPLRDGRFYVTHAEPGRVDIVAVDRLGQRADGLRPSDPEKYTVFGMPVLAPCDGRVFRTADGLPDGQPGAADASSPLGNHVVLECGAVTVTLAHLRRGSVEVQVGAEVKRGDRIGSVGSSGEAAEPLLSVRARRQGPARQPVAMAFDGRALSRGLVPPAR